jgi:hypothetical protein
MTVPQPAIVGRYQARTSGIKTPPAGIIAKTNISSSSNTSTMITSLKWITAIQEANQCLRDLHTPRMNGNDVLSRRPIIMEVTEHALIYLMKLENILQICQSQWDQPPMMDPPLFQPFQMAKKKTKTKKMISNKKKKRSQNNKAAKSRGSQNTKGHSDSITSTVGQSPTSVMMTWTPKSRGRSDSRNSNRFATLYIDDDDEEVEESEPGTPTTTSATSESFGDMQEAGDVPTLNRVPEFPAGNGMAMRRLMIRIATAQSELFASQASRYRKLSNWALGAETCHASLWKIHHGLLLADSEISRCLADGTSPTEREYLMEDAAIVEVAVKSLTQERDSFVQKALAQKHILIRALEVSYIARNKARLRMGEGQWCGNRVRNEQRAREREQQEHQLVDIQVALDHMLQMDTRSLALSADQLKNRLKHTPQASYLIHRHNKQRPADYVANRVSYEQYPDPAAYDWVFTGSYCENGNRLEFFEKLGMLLDFDFCTGVLELSWKHLSRQGNTTFFRSSGPTPSNLYLRLLESPRAWEVANEHKKMQASMPGHTTTSAGTNNASWASRSAPPGRMMV